MGDFLRAAYDKKPQLDPVMKQDFKDFLIIFNILQPKEKKNG